MALDKKNDSFFDYKIDEIFESYNEWLKDGGFENVSENYSKFLNGLKIALEKAINYSNGENKNNMNSNSYGENLNSAIQPVNVVNLSDVNQLISNMSLSDIGYSSTPPLKALRIIGSSNNLCNNWDKYIIYDRFFNHEYHQDPEILDDELIDTMCNFILGDNVPNGQGNTTKYKDILAKYFTESMKENLLIKYMDGIVATSSCCYIDTNDILRNLYYNPSINNVPLKHNNGAKVEILFNKLKDILLGRVQLEELKDKIIVLTLLNNNEFFQGPWISMYIIGLKEKLLKEGINTVLENHVSNYDDELIKSIKDGKKSLETGVDDCFIDSIINNIPKELSLLEKSIYLYSKLCRIFTYDSSFYLNDRSTHDLLDANNMSNYNDENNSIVCHNFAYILSVALKKIGIEDIKENIKYIPRSQRFTGYSNLLYLVDDIAVFVDSTKEVIGGDLEVYKLSNDLNGIRCEMYGKDKQERFRQSKEKVENIVKYEDSMIENLLPSRESIKNFSLNEKYMLFNLYLEHTNFTNIDFLLYANKLIEVMELNVETKVMYSREDLNRISLKVSVIGDYLLDGSRDKLEYIIDSVSKNVVLGDGYDILEKKILTIRRSK